MYKSCVICIHKKICILQIVHWSEISTNCSGITYSWTSCWVQIMFSKISGGRWPLSVRLLVFVKITQSWLLYISRKLGNQIHVQNNLKLFLDICRYLAAQGVQNLVLKKCMISFFFFFCCAYLSSRLSRVPPCYKSEICLHIFWDFFFFFNKLCIIWRKKPAHLPSGCFLILLCSPLLCPGPCWGFPGGSAQGSAVPIAGVWALSWCSLTEKKGVSENLFAGVTGMLSGFGSVSKHISTYECCQGVNPSLSVCFLSMSSHKRLYFH